MSDGTSSPSRPTSPSASVLAANDLPTARPYRFVWDPSTRRPGPESVAGTTEGGRYGDYIVGNAQHPLGVLNNPSSMNLAHGSLPVEWSSTRLGFHAISTVLNNPHKKQAPPKAHSSLPSVPPADLPRVRRKDFDSYLKAIKPEWDRYERNTQLGKEGQAHVDPTRVAAIEEEEEDEADDADDGTLTIQRQRSSSTTGSTAPLSPLPLQARSIPPLDTVPQVFFHTDFNLGDARTFDAVTEQSSLASLATPTQANIRTSSRDLSREDDDDPTDPLSISHTLPLLEKFDHYADTVEQHLIREISLRSTSFFAALTNLRDLQTSSTQCLSRIENLRQKLKEVDEGTAKKGLELVRVKAKQDKVQEVREGVKMVEGVVEMMGVLKGLVGAGQWGEALNIVDEIEGMWESERDEVGAKRANGNGNASVPNGSRLESMAEEEGTEEGAFGAPRSRNGHRPSGKVIPLSSLKAFGAIPSHLRTITMDIAASLSAELVAVLKDDWILYVEARGTEALKAETGDGSSLNGTNANTNGSVGDRNTDAINQGLRDRLRPLLLNLVRTKGLKEGMLSWKEIIQGELKALVSKKLPGLDVESEGSDGNDEVRAGLANHLRNLPQEDFMALMKGIYRTLMNGIERLKSQGEILSDMLEALKPELSKRRTPRTPTASSTSNPQTKAPNPSLPLIPSIEEDLNDFLSSSCELANTTAAKVVAFRSEKHAKLELPEFMDFFNTSWGFVVRCEVISKRMIIGLRGTVVSQAKLWLQTFHQARISHSAKLVEDEVWNPAPVTREVQRMTDIIMDSAVKDSPELVIDLTRKAPEQSSGDTSKEVNGTSSQGDSSTNPPPTARTPATPSKPGSTTPLRIEERTYFTVKATHEVLELLLDYLKVVVNMNMLTTDTMSRVIEFLKAFNSRTCQVVLGAGAMRSAGLKNITAKHLALASQSLSVVFELIPYVRETFRRHLSQKQAVMLVEFDKLKRDYQEHQNEIHAKLVAIMGDRLTAHIKTLHTIDWNATSPEGGANTYMVALVKETVQLHKILSRYLPLPVVEFVMSQVLAATNHRLSEEYAKIELRDQQAKNRLLEDARYLNQHFSTLKNIRAPTAMLETVVAEKMLPRPAGAQQVPQTPLRANTLTANQRLKGLLSGRGSSFMDKNLPQPSRTPTPPVPPPADTKAQPPAMSLGNSSSNGPSVLGIDGSVSGSSASLSPPIETAGGPGGGFRQLDTVNSGGSPEVSSTPDPSVSASPPPPPPKADSSGS